MTNNTLRLFQYIVTALVLMTAIIVGLVLVDKLQNQRIKALEIEMRRH